MKRRSEIRRRLMRRRALLEARKRESHAYRLYRREPAQVPEEKPAVSPLAARDPALPKPRRHGFMDQIARAFRGLLGASDPTPA